MHFLRVLVLEKQKLKFEHIVPKKWKRPLRDSSPYFLGHFKGFSSKAIQLKQSTHNKERMDEGEMSRKSISGSWYSSGTEERAVERKLGRHFFVLEEAATLEEAM